MSQTSTVLIADDDPSLRQVITAVLQEDGFNVIQAADGAECLRMAYARHPDLVLLDIMMPNKDGREVCQQLREVSAVPIIMLTALSMEKEKVARLLEGADDYITKPFNNAELIARIRAVLRRYSPAHDQRRNLYDDGRLFIDFDAHQVRVGDVKVDLTLKEWQLFEYLVRNANRVVPRQTLLLHVWGEGFENEIDYLKVFISKLRKKLFDSAFRPRYIHTERDIGYRFETHK